MRSAPLALLLLAACASAASAAERGYSINDFDRIRVEGPFAVTVHLGPAAAARASGTGRALDGVTVTANDGTLVIRADHQAWGGWPGGAQDDRVTIAVTTPSLRGVALIGSGAVHVDRMRGPALALSVGGSGAIDVAAVDADKLGLALSGSGGITVAGRARQANLLLQGAGDIDAAGLTAGDAVVSAMGSGNIALAATRSAKVQSGGSGDVTVSGTPACTVAQTGSGTVRCGR